MQNIGTPDEKTERTKKEQDESVILLFFSA